MFITNKIIQHELLHAFMYESGITPSSSIEWAHDEGLIEWLVMLLPKMFVAMKECDVLER